MPRVFVDPNAHSTDWFPAVLPELIASSKVTFVFSNCEKGLKEVAKVRKALEFKQAMIKSKKGVQADQDAVERQKALLEAEPDFVACSHCDDGHIFAAIYIHPTPFVFSSDKRMAKCRSKIASKVSKRYCQFAVVSSFAVYQTHRPKLV